jgi:hypothetical protein
MNGMPLVPGVNADKLDVTAGLDKATALGYGTPAFTVVIDYALRRHARGEEAGAEKTALGHDVDLTSWRVILAAAMAAAVAPPVPVRPPAPAEALRAGGAPVCTRSGKPPALFCAGRVPVENAWPFTLPGAGSSPCLYELSGRTLGEMTASLAAHLAAVKHLGDS